MAVFAVNDSNFEQEVVNSQLPVVLDFWAPWCNPCKMIGESLNQLAPELEGKVKIVTVNIEECPSITSKMGILNVPMLFFYKGGQVTNQKTGAPSKGDILRWILGNLG